MGNLTDEEWLSNFSPAEIMEERRAQHEEALAQRKKFGIAEDSREPWLVLNVEGLDAKGKFRAGDGNGKRIASEVREWFFLKV